MVKRLAIGWFLRAARVEEGMVSVLITAAGRSGGRSSLARVGSGEIEIICGCIQDFPEKFPSFGRELPENKLLPLLSSPFCFFEC